MVRFYKIENNRLIECQKDDSLLIQYIAPTSSDLNEIKQNFDIDEHDLNSSLDANELSRLEYEDDYTALIIKTPERYISAASLLFNINSMGIFLAKNKMILIMAEDIQLFEGKQFTKVKTSGDVLIKILYVTISHFLGHLKVINMVSEDIEQKITTSMSNKHLINMFSLEKSLVYYLDGINSNSKVIDKLRISARKLGFNEENMDMLEDIIIENQQCQKQAEIYLNILTGLMDARGSIVNNNLSLLIKRLTIINIVFMPLNLITGIFGMSEYSMMTTGSDWRLSYAIFFVLTAVLGIVIYLFIRRIGSEAD